jgi:hypothetical protein
MHDVAMGLRRNQKKMKDLLSVDCSVGKNTIQATCPAV